MINHGNRQLLTTSQLSQTRCLAFKNQPRLIGNLGIQIGLFFKLSFFLQVTCLFKDIRHNKG